MLLAVIYQESNSKTDNKFMSFADTNQQNTHQRAVRANTPERPQPEQTLPKLSETHRCCGKNAAWLTDYLGSIQEQAVAQLGSSAISLWLIDTSEACRHLLCCDDFTGDTPGRDARIRKIHGPQLTALFVEEKTVRVGEGDHEEILARARANDWVMPDAETILTTAIEIGGEIVGTVNFEYNENRVDFSDSERRSAGYYASMIGLAIENCELRRADRFQATLCSISKDVHGIDNLAELSKAVYHRVSQLLDVTCMALTVFDETNDDSSCNYRISNDASVEAESSPATEKSLVEYTRRTGRLLYVTGDDCRQLEADGEITVVEPVPVFIGLPLLHEQRVIGVLAVTDQVNCCHYSERELEFLSTVGELVASAVEHRQSQMLLLESEERWRTLAEASFEGILTHDNGMVIDCNKMLADMAGYDLDEIKGMNAIEFLSPEYRQLAAERIQEGYEKPYRAVAVHSSGRRIEVELQGKTIPFRGRKIRVTAVKDITEANKAEQALRQSEHRYRMLFSSVNDAILVYAIKDDSQVGKLVEANDICCRMFGYTRDELFDLTPADFTRDYGKYTFAQVMDELVMKGQVLFERLGVTKSGQQFPLEINCQLFELDGVRLAVATARDISERKRAVERLRRSENKFSNLFHQSNDCIFVHDFSGNIIDINQKAIDTLGYTREELRHIKIVDLHPPTSLRKSVRAIRDITQKSAAYVELEFQKKNGDIFPAELSAHIVEIDGKTLIQGMVRDITDRKLSDSALRKSSSRLALMAEEQRILLENTRDFIYRQDRKRCFTYLSPSVEKILGYPVEECIASLPAFLTDSPVNEKVKELTEKTLRTGVTNPPYMAEVLCRDGRQIILEVNEKPYFEDNKVAGIIGVARDITDRVEQERQRQSLKSQLEKAERMQSLGVLAGGVAHDLNNILGPLVAYPELILLKLPEDSPVRKQVELMGRSAREAADIIQDLLSLARRGRYEMGPTSINEVVTTYLSSPSCIELENRKPNIQVATELDRDIGNVMGSAPHLSKVVMNLVINAYDAIDDDGGGITVSTCQEWIDRLYSGFDKIHAGEYVILSIKDSGVGIAEDNVSKIFEPYYSSKKMGKSGSGLGLSVVYGILRDHHGYYDVLSAPGQGTEFLMYFPITSEAVDNTDKVPGDLSGHETILIIDDVAEQREVATEILRSLNYAVMAVSSGEEAVAYLMGNSADLVVIDMIMDNGMDGLETYERILRHNPGQKAIIVSGFSATDRVNKMQELGAGAYIKKPYTRDILGKAIRDELARRPA